MTTVKSDRTCREDHDQNFKNLILGYPREALEFFACNEAALIPTNAVIMPLYQQLQKERLDDRFYEMDVPLEVRFPDGERMAIVFCIEENSNGQRTDLRRHAIYALKLSEYLDTNRVVPVAIHPFDEQPPAETLELSGDFGTYLQFKVLSTTLKALEALRHVDSKNRVALICLPLMKCNDEQRQDVLERSIEGLYDNEPNAVKFKKFTRFILGYSGLPRQEWKKWVDAYVRDPRKDPRRKEAFVSVLDIIKEDGRSEGKVEGNAEGEIKTIFSFLKSGLITSVQAREQLEKFATDGDIPQDKLREALAQLPQK